MKIILYLLNLILKTENILRCGLHLTLIQKCRYLGECHYQQQRCYRQETIM